MTSESYGASPSDAPAFTQHLNGFGGETHANGGAPASSAFDGAKATSDLLDSFVSHELDVCERCEDLAKQLATALNHGEWTFAHLLLAMTQVPEAREKLQEYKYLDAAGSYRSFNVEGARRAAFAALTGLEQGSPALMDESGELKTILNCARLKARKRERVYLTKQPIAVKDILDAVLEQGAEAQAFRLLNSHLPSSPLLEIRDSLLHLKSAIESQATWNLGLVQRIALMDQQLHGRLTTLDVAVKEQPKLIADALTPTIPRRLIAAGGVVSVVALALLAGFALGHSGIGIKLIAWLGQWIA